MENEKVIYPELSYKIIGCLFEVYNDLSFGYREKYYYNAIKKAFDRCGIRYKEQFCISLTYKDEKVGKFFIDFLVENKVVLEIKVGNYFSRKNIEQTYQYLKSQNLKLGLLVNFTRSGIKFRRILNIT